MAERAEEEDTGVCCRRISRNGTEDLVGAGSACALVGKLFPYRSIDRSAFRVRPSALLLRATESADEDAGRLVRRRRGRGDRSDHEQQKERSITRNDPPKEKTCKKTSTPHRQRLEMRFRGRRQTSSGLHREWYSDLML
mmetsp:Transcript_20849/g.49341  ORF Transcript_20849/g.49341 Transcript_20849/m.49341 type:complete len:139 (-) Transcript_20849:738-1154(-)